MKKKYYIVWTTPNKVAHYRLYKNGMDWSENYEGCYQFSESGARRYCADMNAVVEKRMGNSNRPRSVYSYVAVDEISNVKN